MMNYLRARSRDNARTPMQWDSTTYAGFSDVTPWLEVNANHESINVDAALKDKESLFYFYQRLITLRHELPVITDGTFDLVTGNEKDEAVFAYTRKNDKEVLLVIANFTAQSVSRAYNIPKDSKLLIQNYPDVTSLALRPYEIRAYLFSNRDNESM